MIPVAGTEATRKGRVAKFKCPREALPFSSRVEEVCLEGETNGEDSPVSPTKNLSVPYVGRKQQVHGNGMRIIEFATLAGCDSEMSEDALSAHVQDQVPNTPNDSNLRLNMGAPVHPKINLLKMEHNGSIS